MDDPSGRGLQQPDASPAPIPAPASGDRVRPPRWRSVSNDHVLASLDSIRLAGLDANRGPRPFPHPFPARMPLDVALALIEQLSAPRDVILDPMAGSGTTAAASLALGRHAVAFDSDPLASMLALARGQPAAPERLLTAAARVVAHARRDSAAIDLKEQYVRLAGLAEVAFLNRWFPAEAQAQLFAIVNHILVEPDVRARTSLLALFSSMIITKQGGVTFGLDVARSRAHYCAEKRPAVPLDDWTRRAPAFVRHSAAQKALPHTNCVIARGDARALPLADGAADLILTSPPYLNAIDYMRAHRFTLVWLGYPLDVLRDVQSGAIGTERGLFETGLPEPLEAMLSESSADRRRKPMLRRFLADMLSSLRESRRCLRPSGLAVYEVGPSILSRSLNDGGDVLAEIARHAGWDVVGQIERDFAADRRSLPVPRRNRRASSHRALVPRPST
jgi:DNA modification methylase